ncbi:MAG: ABC transporter ATP-binding protein [Ruminococcaceae bacterium]|nr:ABC transporter ATP-binding protein [Oscillospiraceae bacterium]
MIELKQLCAGYTSDEVLHGITASLGHGMLVSIVGPNGCGKSTLLKTVAGILRVQNGEVLLDGISASAMRRDALAARIAYLAQGKQAPAMTVGEMVLHGRFPHLHFPRRYSARDREIAGTAMEALGIMQYADTPVAALSGGMRQSAYLAMALTQEADYILLDEPTTYLDIANQISLMRLLHKLSRDGHGIAAVMHDLPLSLAYSDEIWVMRDGILVMTASPQEIVSSGVLHEVFGVDVRADSGQYSYHFV